MLVCLAKKNFPSLHVSASTNSPGKGAGEARLEVEKADPFRRHRDSHHARNHPAQLLDPGLPLLRTEVAFGGRRVFRNNPVEGLQAGGAADQQNLVREGVVVDGERDFGILLQGFDFGGFWRRAQDEFVSVPVEPDGDDSGRAIGPDVGEAGRDFGLQQFFRGGMLEEAEVALFDRHGSPFSRSRVSLLVAIRVRKEARIVKDLEVI